jgi:hypothetical protein
MSTNYSDRDIRMAILTKNGYRNACWYNYPQYNGKEPNWIIDDMLTRFPDAKIAQHTQTLQFYNNRTGELLRKVDM